jgi:hypothetical protein
MGKSWVVLAVVVVAALSGCSGEKPAAPSAPTTASAAPSTAPDRADDSPAVVADDASAYGATLDGTEWEGVNFVSPSRNEGCAILGPSSPEPDLWGCALATQDWAFPDTGPDDFCFESEVPCGYGIEATGGESPHPRRRGDAGFPSAAAIFDATGTQPVVATLPYGHSVSYGDITCVSAESGVTCSNAASGHGFAVSKSSYELH